MRRAEVPPTYLQTICDNSTRSQIFQRKCRAAWSEKKRSQKRLQIDNFYYSVIGWSA